MQNQHLVPTSDPIPRAGAGCLVLFGAVAIAYSVLALISGDVYADRFLAGTLGLISSGAGFYWYRYVTRAERLQLEQFEEKVVLGVAARNGGVVSLARLSLEGQIGAAAAERTLARLSRQGLARPELLDDGTVVYRFGGLLGPGDPELPTAT